MSTPRAERNDYQQLAKAAQRIAKTFTERSTGSDGGAAGDAAYTEVEALAVRAKAMDEALALDLVALARQVVEGAGAQRNETARRLLDLKNERADVDRRRDQLAKAAIGYDWGMQHTGKRDFIGPLTIEHFPEASVILVGKVRRGKLVYPSGQELFDAVKVQRADLEKQAKEIWEEMKRRIVPLQRTPESTIPWSEVVGALSTPELPFKKREASVLYALSLLRAGRMEGGWSASFRQPTLAQQNEKDAITLPRIDRPGSPDRIAALRLNAPH